MAVFNQDEEFELLRCLKGHVIKTYKNSKFTDLLIRTKDGGEIKAHKLILYAQNAFFARKLELAPDLKEIIVEDFPGEIVKNIVDSIYYKKLNPSLLTKENAFDYLRAGEVFYIDTIRDEAAMYMAENLDTRYALDMILKPVFKGVMEENAYNYITENFQVFMSDEKLKKRVLNEINADKLSNIIARKNLMLWDPSGRFVPAVEREKKLFFFVLGYVAQNKEDRLPDLKLLVKSLKMSLLVPQKVINIPMMGAGLKEPNEEVSGLIADVLEPFEKVKPTDNLATLTHKDTKDKSKSSSDLKMIGEGCRLRFGSIPHQCACSDLVLKLEPWSQMSQTKFQFAPAKLQEEKVVCSGNLKSITVFIQGKKKDGSENATNKTSVKDKDSVKDKNSAKSKDSVKDKDSAKANEAVKDKDKVPEKEKDEEKEKDAEDKSKDKADLSEEKEDKGDEAKEKDGEKGDKDKKSDEESEKNAVGDDDKGKADEKEEEEEEENMEWRVCGIKITSGEKELTLGVLEGEGVRSKEYVLEEGEFITEIAAHFEKEKVSSLDGRGKRKEMVAKEMFSMTCIEDYSFKTNTGKVLGPILETKNKPVVGLFFRLPRQILRLEAESPSNFWWLQGFGSEKIQLQDTEEKTRFFPIWKFGSSFKYYPNDYQGFEFVAGIKKHLQFSLEGIEECLELQTTQDLDMLERTPVHELVDLDDSEEEEEQVDTADKPHKSVEINEDSVMIVDSGSSDDGGEVDDEGEEEEDDGFDDDDDADDYTQSLLQHPLFGGLGGLAGAGDGKNGTGGGAEEPIEIPSSSDDEEEEEVEEPVTNGKGKGKRSSASSPTKSAKKKK